MMTGFCSQLQHIFFFTNICFKFISMILYAPKFQSLKQSNLVIVNFLSIQNCLLLPRFFHDQLLFWSLEKEFTILQKFTIYSNQKFFISKFVCTTHLFGQYKKRQKKSGISKQVGVTNVGRDQVYSSQGESSIQVDGARRRWLRRVLVRARHYQARVHFELYKCFFSYSMGRKTQCFQSHSGIHLS